MGICFAVAVLVPFIVFPMDALYNKFASPSDPININAYQELKKDTALTHFDVEQGNYLVGFYISKCKFCKLSMKKINTIVEKHDLDINRIKLFISGSDEGIEAFKKEIAMFDYQFIEISIYSSLKVTDGSFPTFLYVCDGKIVKSFNLRGISEDELVDFLK